MLTIKQSVRNTVLGIVLFTALNCGGAAQYKKVKLPTAPTVRSVNVQNGVIKGRSLDNVIKNHIDAWKYIKELQTLGNFKK